MGDVILGEGLGFFGLHHRALGPNRHKELFFFLLKSSRESASLELLIGLLAFVVGSKGLETTNHISSY